MALNDPATDAQARARPRALTGARRRTLYGFNVGVALLAAAALVVLVNALAGWTAARTVRLDLTRDGSQTLSPQTRRLAGTLDADAAVQWVGLFSRGDGPRQQAAAEMLTRYAAASPHLSARLVTPGRASEELATVYAEIEARLGDDVGRVRAGVQRAAGTLREAEEASVRLAARLSDAASQLEAGGGVDRLVDGVATLLRDWAGVLAGGAEAARVAAAQADASLDTVLPDYAALQLRLGTTLGDLRDDVLRPLSRDLGRRRRDSALPNAARAAVLEAFRVLEPLAADLDAAAAALATVAVGPRYSEVAQVLGREPAVLALGVGERMRVIPLREMFAGDAFLGEERLTASLLALRKDAPPEAWLVGGGDPAAGLTLAVERLRRAGFSVRAWNPQDGRAPAGLDAGRPRTWLVLPINHDDPAAVEARATTAALLDERLAAGEGALVTVASRRAAAFATPDPVLVQLERRGLAVNPGSVLTRRAVAATGEAVNRTAFAVQDWPAGAPLSEALAGTRSIFAITHPIAVARPAVAQAVLRSGGSGELWAESEPFTGSGIVDATPDGGELRESAAIIGTRTGTAADGDADADAGGRVVVVAADTWMTDRLVRGQRASGNLELLAAAAYWTAGLDRALAPTPRASLAATIGEISPAARQTIRWALLAVLPGSLLLTGTLIVWLRR